MVVPIHTALDLVVPYSIQAEWDELFRRVPRDHFFPVCEMKKLLYKYGGDSTILRSLCLDFTDLEARTFRDVGRKRSFVATAGGPRSGKSTLLEGLLSGGSCPDASFDHRVKRAYIDPDRSCLFKMSHTYMRDRARGVRDPEEAYTYWREASICLANLFLARALDEGDAIAFGSTMATPNAVRALDAIEHRYGYEVTILHVTCDEEVRVRTEEDCRARGIVQCTPKDFKEKNGMFFSLLPEYVKHRVVFYWRGEGETVCAAKMDKGELVVYNREAFAQIIRLHDAAQGAGFCGRVFP